jgi:hypothetical protein
MNASPDKMLLQFEKSPLGKASPTKKSGKKRDVTSSTKKKSKRVNENENAGESVSPVKRSSPLKAQTLGFGVKSPSKKQMRLLEHQGDEPDCDDEISPFKSTEKAKKRGSLLESLEKISFNDEEPLLRTESVKVIEEELELGSNLLKERKISIPEPVVQPCIESILELDVPIINYGSFISTKVLGSTLQLTNKTK